MKKLLAVFALVSISTFLKSAEDTLHYNKRCVLKLGIAAVYQNNKFVNTDFTGVNTFIYENKIRYSTNAKVEIDLSEKYFLIAGVRVQDVGWKRLDTVSYVETHRDHSKYSFLYLSPSIGIARRVYKENIFELSTALGIDPEFRIYQTEKIYFSDHSVKQIKPLVETIKYNTLFWLSVNSSFSLGNDFSLGINYLCGINYQSFNKSIIPGNLFLQSLGINFGIKL